MIWRLCHGDPARASAAKSTCEPSDVNPYASSRPLDWKLFLLVSEGTPFDHVRSATYSLQPPNGTPHCHCSLQTTRVPVLSNRGQMSAPVPEVMLLVSRHACDPSAFCSQRSLYAPLPGAAIDDPFGIGQWPERSTVASAYRPSVVTSEMPWCVPVG